MVNEISEGGRGCKAQGRRKGKILGAPPGRPPVGAPAAAGAPMAASGERGCRPECCLEFGPLELHFLGDPLRRIKND